MSQKKQGNLQIIVPAVLTLILAAAILVFGLILTEKLRDSGYATGTSVAVTAETVTPNQSGTNLAYYLQRSVSCTINAVTNGSAGGKVLTTGNYSLVAPCKIRNLTSEYMDSSWRVNYTYTYDADTEATRAGNKTVVGLGTFADFWEIIVLAIVITVVISLLLVVFSGRKVK